jgi:CheY-like chemotaxis protein
MISNAALTVDDDDALRHLTAALLGRAGFDPEHTARDGQEALDLLATNEYCVVVLDLRMPRLSGYDVLARLSSHPLPTMPKIIIATAERGVASHNLSHDVVTTILTKPFDAETLIAAARSCRDTD